MKKLYCLFGLLLIIRVSGFGQSPQVVMGPMYEAAGQMHTASLLYAGANGFVMVRQNESYGARYVEPNFEFYNKELVLTNTSVAGWEEGRQKLRPYMYFSLKESIYGCFNYVRPGSREVADGFRRIDPHTGKYDGDMILFDQQKPTDESAAAASMRMMLRNEEILSAPWLNGTYSPDSTKVLRFTQVFAEKGAPEKFHAAVHHESGFNLLFSTEITLPYENQLLHVHRTGLGNDGTIYVLAVLYSEHVVLKSKGNPNYKYLLLVYPPGSNQGREYVLDLGDRFITDLSFKVTVTGDVVCAGFVSDLGLSSGTHSGPNRGVSTKGINTFNGIVFFRVDGATGTLKTKSILDLPETFLDQFRADETRGEGKELFDYDLDRILLKADGGVIILAEQYYLNGTGAAPGLAVGGAGTYATYTYHYNNIVAASVSPEGQIEWCVKIPKKQKTVNDMGFYSSFATAIVDDKVIVVFNDNPENINIAASGEPLAFNGKQSAAVAVTIDNAGNIKKEILFSNKATGAILVPKMCTQFSGNQLLLYSTLRRGYFLSIVSF